jgi:hypothetical protein
VWLLSTLQGHELTCRIFVLIQMGLNMYRNPGHMGHNQSASSGRTSTSIYFAVAACWLIAFSPPSMAKDAQAMEDKATQQWQRVQSLAPGTEVQVRPFDGKTVNGRFVSAEESALTVRLESTEMRIGRSEIRLVRAKRGSARLKGGAIGAAIGAAAGLLIAVALDGALTDGNGVSREAAGVLSALGGGIGFGLGVIPTGYVKIYKARR